MERREKELKRMEEIVDKKLEEKRDEKGEDAQEKDVDEVFELSGISKEEQHSFLRENKVHLRKLVEHIPEALFPVDLIFFHLNHLQPIQQTIFNALRDKAEHYVREAKERQSEKEKGEKKGDGQVQNRGASSNENNKEKLSKEQLEQKRQQFAKQFMEKLVVEEDDDLFSLSGELPLSTESKQSNSQNSMHKKCSHISKGRAIAFIRALFLICKVSFADLCNTQQIQQKEFHHSKRDQESVGKAVWRGFEEISSKRCWLQVQ